MKKNFISVILIAILFVSCKKDSSKDENQISNLNSLFSTTEVSVSGTPFDLKTNGYNPLGRYGVTPQIIISGNCDNSFDIAWLDLIGKKIKISVFDANNQFIKDIVPSFIGTTSKLLGFTKITTDGSYVCGYSKNNSAGDIDFEFWIARFNSSGTMIFNKRIFGDVASTVLWSKGAPAQAASARIVFNTKTQKICFYLGHTMKWEDGIRHQGGYIGFLDLNGNQLMKNTSTIVGDTWFFSHNFDQRIIVDDGIYYALAHGDAYPRALGFSAWNDNSTSSNPLVNKQYFQISGSIGDNTTHTQTGGIVRLSDGNFGIFFSSSIGRTKRDVCFMKIDKSGKVLLTKWITTNSSTDAVNPKIALHGTAKILLAWDDYTTSSSKANFIEINNNAEIVTEKIILDKAILQPLSDMITLPCGDVIWPVYFSATKKLNIFRIKFYR